MYLEKSIANRTCPEQASSDRSVVRSGCETSRQKIHKRRFWDFLSGIEQDIDRMDQTPPEDSLLTSGLMFFETIVIEQALIDPLGSGSSLHEGFPLLGTPGNAANMPQILIGRDIDGSAIV
jgi:hypothetical protein